MRQRLELLRDILKNQSLDAIIISSVPNIFYLTGCNNFSVTEREAYVLITKHNSYFFTTKLYIEEVQKKAKSFIFQIIGRDEPFIPLLKTICKNERLQRIGFEEHNISYFEYYWISQVSKNLSPKTFSIRIQKDRDELEAIQKACELTDRAMEYIIPKIRRGITEKALATIIEIFLKEAQSDTSFTPIIAFGGNGAIPHHSSGTRRLVDNEFILFDIGAMVDGYCSDMTRTLFFGRKPETVHKTVYQVVLEAQEKAIEYIDKAVRLKRPVYAKDADRVAREYITSAGFPTLPHSLGHGIGAEVHEAPRLSPASSELLIEGMVFSVEPGIYLPGSIGVRIEDLVTITSKGVKILTHFPKKFATL